MAFLAQNKICEFLRLYISMKKFGELAVDLGLIDSIQLQECLNIQAQQNLSGQNHRVLGQIMIAQGYLMRSQIGMILKQQEESMSIPTTQQLPQNGLNNIQFQETKNNIPNILDNIPDSEPLDNIPDSEPLDNIPDSEPLDNIPDSEPLDSIPDAEPLDNIPDAEPLDNIPDSEPLDNIPDSEPLDNIPDSEPLDNIPDSEPLDNILDSEAMNINNTVLEESQSSNTQNSSNQDSYVQLDDIKEQDVIEEIQIEDSNNDNQEGLSLDFGNNDNQEGLSLDFGDNDNQEIENNSNQNTLAQNNELDELSELPVNNNPLTPQENNGSFSSSLDENISESNTDENNNNELNTDNIPTETDYQSTLRNEDSLFETLGFNPIGDALDLDQESANKNRIDEVDHKMEEFIANNANQEIENNSTQNGDNEQESNNTELENLLLNHPQNNIFSQNNATAETIVTDINLRKESHAKSQETNLFDSNLDVKWSESAVEPKKKINFDTDNIPTSVNYQADLGNKENLFDTFGFKPIGDALDLDQASYKGNITDDSKKENEEYNSNEEYNNELDDFRGSDTIIDKNVSSQEKATSTKKSKNLSNLKSSTIHHSKKVKLQGNYTSRRSRYLEEAHKKSGSSGNNIILIILAFIIIGILVYLLSNFFNSDKKKENAVGYNNSSEMSQIYQDNDSNTIVDEKKN